MNTSCVSGRWTKDPIASFNSSGELVAVRGTIASPRRFVNREGNRETDFIPVVAYGKTAEFVNKFMKKGTKAEIRGRIQTGSYKKDDGSTVYTVDVVIEDIEFAESKKSQGGDQGQNQGQGYQQNQQNQQPQGNYQNQNYQNQGYQNQGYQQNQQPQGNYQNQNQGYQQNQQPQGQNYQNQGYQQGYQQNYPNQQNQNGHNDLDGFMNLPSGIDEQLPFS